MTLENYIPKILPVVQIGHVALKTKCMTVQDTVENRKNLMDLLATQLSIKNSVGLAANQCNLLLNAFVGLIDDQSKLVINPVIKKGRNPYISKEGCLSLPTLSVPVERFDLLEVEYLDENFRKQRRKLKGLPAAVFQHEKNHIDGITLADFLSDEHKSEVQRQLSRIEKGEIQVLYSILLADGTVIHPSPDPKSEPFIPSILVQEGIEKLKSGL